MKEQVHLLIKNQAYLSSEGPKQLCKDIESSTDETSMYSEKLKDQHNKK